MSTKDVVRIAMFAALTAALAVVPPLALPVTGVPITAQSLGPMLAGAVTGWKRAALSQLLFVALVAAGLPLVAGGNGGFGLLLGPRGGFLLAFPVAALVTGWLFQRYWDHLNTVSAFGFVVLGGIVVLYAIGNMWVSVVTDLTYIEATIVSAVYLPGDIFKAVAATAIAMTLRRSYPLMPAPVPNVT
jgi:biotin transport system substrate-specific component